MLEQLPVEWFGNEVCCTCLEGLIDRVRFGVAGRNEDRNFHHPQFFAHRTTGREAIDARQMDIEENQVRTLFGGGAQSFLAALGFANLEAEGAEHLISNGAQYRIVVDDQGDGLTDVAHGRISDGSRSESAASAVCSALSR